METEIVLTGYCRNMDLSRMVLIEEGEVGCAYLSCAHVQSCELAQKIRQVLQEEAR